MAFAIACHPVRRSGRIARGRQVGLRVECALYGQRPYAGSGNLQERPVARDRFKGPRWVVGWGDKVSQNVKMIDEALVFIAKNKMERLCRQKSACVLHEQAMGCSKRIMLCDQNR